VTRLGWVLFRSFGQCFRRMYHFKSVVGMIRKVQAFGL
jgi:hypothetical protein